VVLGNGLVWVRAKAELDGDLEGEAANRFAATADDVVHDSARIFMQVSPLIDGLAGED
jgi:hypothetical protein